MNDRPAYAINDLFTDDEIAKATELYEACAAGTFNKEVTEKVVRPVLARIDAKTGQANDARYLGYMIEHVLNLARAADRRP
jgi:hypothetical protein